MSGKKGSIVIKVDEPPENGKKHSGAAGREHPATKLMRDVLEFAKEDTNRVTFSLKLSLAVLLVSLLILIRAPYDVFGTNIIWSILTVAVMFEYSVGATFNRGFNRALGSLLAGIFAVAMMQAAMACGQIAEPYVIALSIFFVGAITSFMKLYPTLAPYEYGFRVILFTYCLIIVSGYRMGNPIRTAMDRIYSIAIGGIVTVLVNSLVFPIWAGEQLHRELVGSFNSVADALEECVNKYVAGDRSSRREFADEPAFDKCRAMLNSSAKFEAVADSAKWEPPHGRFRRFFYPWSEYVKVGAALQHCAYEVMALHGCLHSEIQAPYKLRCTFQPEILDATNQAAELLRSLGKDINNMKQSLHTNLLNRVRSSTERLQRSIDTHTYLLTSSHEIQDFAPKLPPSQPSNAITLNFNNERPNSVQADSYHETMRKQLRRLYSWPSREVDDYEDRGVDAELLHKMHTFESSAALSLSTFTSLLVEFVARLDSLVDATDLLAKMAKFKEDCYRNFVQPVHSITLATDGEVDEAGIHCHKVRGSSRHFMLRQG